MVASGFFVFNVAPIYWCEQIKTKNTGLRSKARVSMLGLNQFWENAKRNPERLKTINQKGVFTIEK